MQIFQQHHLSYQKEHSTQTNREKNPGIIDPVCYLNQFNQYYRT